MEPLKGHVVRSFSFLFLCEILLRSLAVSLPRHTFSISPDPQRQTEL